MRRRTLLGALGSLSTLAGCAWLRPTGSDADPDPPTGSTAPTPSDTPTFGADGFPTTTTVATATLTSTATVRDSPTPGQTTVTDGGSSTGGSSGGGTPTQDTRSLTAVPAVGQYAAENHEAVLADASGGELTVTLPPPEADIHVAVKKIDASENPVRITPPNGETIDGHPELTISTQYASRTIVSDGTDYYII